MGQHGATEVNGNVTQEQCRATKVSDSETPEMTWIYSSE